MRLELGGKKWKKLCHFVISARQAMYLQRGNETHSCYHYCRGRAINITYSECVFVAWSIQLAITHAPNSHLWLLSLYHIFPTLCHKQHDFRKKLLNTSPSMPPHDLYGLRGPPCWAWQEWNRLLRLGRPWGAVTLSRWCVSGDRGGFSARRGLKPKFY